MKVWSRPTTSRSTRPSGPAEMVITDTDVGIECRGISKSFGATVALDDVDVVIARGTVHALVGENGAGKSTLGKIFAGVHRADSGTLHVAGREVDFTSPRDALDARITMIAQELSLVAGRSVIDNVYLGIEDHVGPFVRRQALRTRFCRTDRAHRYRCRSRGPCGRPVDRGATAGRDPPRSGSRRRRDRDGRTDRAPLR